MALTKETIIDKIEIVGQHNILQVRQAINVFEDGNMISQSYHRYVVAPGTTSTDPKVAAVIAALHTSDVVDAYQAHIADRTS